MENENLEQIVRELNYDIQDVYNDFDIFFEYRTIGDCSTIDFCGYTLWNSEDDGRDFDDEQGYESMKHFLLMQLKSFALTLMDISYTIT
jgi:hypothetical protein